MENVKYTTDGKKVVIIGNLNSQEKIVQEIFIINGQEVPSGENFVVKSLHDFPAISWQEKSINDLEKRYKERSEEINKNIENLEKDYDIQKSLLSEKCKYLKKFIDNITVESFDILVKFLKGEIKYVVVGGSFPEIIECGSEEWYKSEWSTGLKLLTLFGNDDGTLTWGLNKYTDGSGYYSKYCYVTTSLDEAKEKLKNEIQKFEKLHSHIIKISKKYNIELDKEKLEKYKEEEKNKIIDEIKIQQEHIKNKEKQIDEIKNL